MSISPLWVRLVSTLPFAESPLEPFRQTYAGRPSQPGVRRAAVARPERGDRADAVGRQRDRALQRFAEQLDAPRCDGQEPRRDIHRADRAARAANAFDVVALADAVRVDQLE